ncbi:MAG: Bug family tripartite tricarboxylate transporter substrate binding protein [Xanthobacteraceae bacterium]
MKLRALLALSFVVGASTPALAQQSVADFYKGKTVRIIVGVSVGSGYDITARAVQRHLGKHIPGNPTVIVQNQPGAGSMTMTNQVYANGPFDGTAIGAPFNGLPTTPLLQPAGVRFDPVKMPWVGSTNRETQVTYLWHTAPAKTFAEVAKTEVVTGAQAPGTTQYDYPTLANDVFKMRFKVVTGYKSTSAIHLAMERGKIHGNGATNWTTLLALNSDWLQKKQVRVVAQWALKKHPDLPDVPLVLDMAKTPADRAAIELAVARLEYGRPFFLPPGVPAERVQALRRAFDATMKDKEFLADAKKLKLEIDPLTGEQVNAVIEKVSRTSPEVAARVRKALAPK